MKPLRTAEKIRSRLRDPDLPDWVRKRLEGELDWIERGHHVNEKYEKAYAERALVELGGPIPARFKHLQHLNKNS